MNAPPLPKPYSDTLRFDELTGDDLLPNEIVISAGDATERRGRLALWDELSDSAPDRILSISQIDSDHISISNNGDIDELVALVDEDSLGGIVDHENLLIDISGLPHHIWAPILKSAYKNQVNTRVMYAEPESYKPHPSPASDSLFDLSIEFGGLAPLPGFVCLNGPLEDDKCIFVAALGFEGNRPERLAFQLDPPPKVVPVVGVPGFQLEYPAFTIACNRNLLEEYRAHSDVRFARASCPFEIYKTLENLRSDFPGHYMYLAPIGTKPHSLGIILFAIANPDFTEVMFDYPIRKKGRTRGIGIIHIYNFGCFDGY